MQYTLLVSVVDSLGNGLHVIDNLCHSQRLLADVVRQTHAFHKVHRNKERTVPATDFVDSDNIRVLELSSSAGVPKEQLR